MRAILIIGALVMAAGSRVGAQDPLGAAKDLYASAAYEDALSQLNRMDVGSTAPEIARQVEEYRVFCLYALGRTREAESVAEGMVRKAPMAPLSSADKSPRLELMFTDVRKRLLPVLIRERFGIAKSALDRKRYADAEPPLTETRLMIVEAEKLGVSDEGLADLGVLVDGFLLLIRSAADRQASQPAPLAASSTTTPPPAASRQPAPEPPARAVPAPPAPEPASRGVSASPAAAGSPRVYSIDDRDVSPPVALDQRMPVISGGLESVIKRGKGNAIVDVLIDETGRVLETTIRQSLHASFDAMIVQSARRWRYQPATKDGVPVRYLKTLLLVP